MISYEMIQLDFSHFSNLPLIHCGNMQVCTFPSLGFFHLHTGDDNLNQRLEVGGLNGTK